MDSGLLHERIEAYLADQLDPVRKSEFEEDLSADQSLRRELNLHRQANAALRLGLRDEWKKKLQLIDKEIPAHSRPRLRILRRVAAAAIGLLMVAVGLHFYAHGTYDHSAIASDRFVTVEKEVFRGTPGESATPAAQLESAQSFFENGDYDEAIMTYLEIIQDNNLRKDIAEWNLLMCYLASDPSGPQLGLLLDRIADNPEHAYQLKALDLRETMTGTMYRLVNR